MGNSQHQIYGFVAKERETGEILGWVWIVRPQFPAWMLGVWNEENRQGGFNFSLAPLTTAN
jgi:hypothetical protein